MKLLMKLKSFRRSLALQSHPINNGPAVLLALKYHLRHCLISTDRTMALLFTGPGLLRVWMQRLMLASKHLFSRRVCRCQTCRIHPRLLVLPHPHPLHNHTTFRTFRHHFPFLQHVFISYLHSIHLSRTLLAYEIMP